jgi:Alr-MurF fusion protein
MNLNYTIEEITSITNGTVRGDSKAIVNSLFIDSRNHFNENNVLFIAIKGDFNDGHEYLIELYEKGLRNFIIERTAREKLITKVRFFKKNKSLQFIEANIIVVENAVVALQKIAAHHRRKFDIPVIGITGSNGKTIVKEWLYHILRSQFNIVRSPKSYNSQVGVPLSILQMNRHHTLAIFEAGISLPGEMEALKEMIKPTLGLLTNIGTAHLENFESKNALINEKRTLFKSCQYIHIDDKDEFADIHIEKQGNHSKINANWKGLKVRYQIPFFDQAAIQNSLSCVALLLKFGIEINFITSKTISLPQIAFRLETRKGKDGNIIILDNYNADIASLRIVLDYLDRHDKSKKRYLILSDIKQDRTKSIDLYNHIAELVNQRNIDNFIGIGKEIMKHRNLFNKGYFYESTEQYIKDLEINSVKNTVILIKGSSEFRFEEICHLLEAKTHETVLEINLNAISHNIKTYKNLLNPETKLLVMVKAFGYGAGSKEIGQILQHNNVDYLGVAYTDEGLDLRNEGIELPILVMNAERSSFNDIIKNDLEPSIFSFKQLDNFIRKLIDLGERNYPIHLKLDTGMNRLGFIEEEIDNFISIIMSQPEVRVKSIFSHLAGSDKSKHNDFTKQQTELFKACANRLESGLGYSVQKHILNSAGIENFPEHQFDMVRLGIGVYGNSSSLNNLEPVGRLKTVITQLKDAPKGSSIGYSRGGFAEDDLTIAIIPIGYADGFSRCLSNGKGHVLVNGKLAPVIGNVCMDMTLINVTDVQCKEGDEVIIFGIERPIEDLAKEMGTISYEVMASISQRVVRVYLED